MCSLACTLAGVSCRKGKEVSRSAAFGKVYSKYECLVIDKAGRPVIQGDYFLVGPFREGLATFVTIPHDAAHRHHLGVIGRDGQIVVEPRFNSLGLFSAEGLAAVNLGGKYGYIDRQGNVVIQPKLMGTWGFSEGLATFAEGTQIGSMLRFGKRGFIDTNGVTRIPALYDDALAFQEGLAAVQVNERWGFIDQAGKWAIVPRYYHASAHYS